MHGGKKQVKCPIFKLIAVSGEYNTVLLLRLSGDAL